MIINYFGKQYFKISQGEVVIAYNPISKDSKHKDKASRFGANIALISVNHKDYNGIDTVTYPLRRSSSEASGETKPFKISGPGEYEVNGISIIGIGSDTEIDKKKYINTIYLINVDSVKICFLGTLSKELSIENRGIIGNPDIIFVPVGGNFLSPQDAYKLAASLESSIIIPMDYEESGLKTFLKEGGGNKIEPIDKLTIRKKDLEEKKGEIIVLEQ